MKVVVEFDREAFLSNYMMAAHMTEEDIAYEIERSLAEDYNPKVIFTVVPMGA